MPFLPTILKDTAKIAIHTAPLYSCHSGKKIQIIMARTVELKSFETNLLEQPV